MKHIGFTGTRKGMSEAQRLALAIMLPRCYFHHGDCVGADAQAHEIALKNCKVLIHPPESPRLRAWCNSYTHRYAPLPYLRRNADIVECCEWLIAAPESDIETQRSGTWSTVRRAQKYRMQFDGCYRIILLLRNGGTQEL